MEDAGRSIEGIRLINLCGTHFEMGQQLGIALVSQTSLLEEFKRLMDKELEFVRSLEPELAESPAALREELLEFLARTSSTTIQMLEGVASGAGLELEQLLEFHLCPYFKDRALICRVQAALPSSIGWPISGEGCSTLAVARGPDGPLLAKNRDYNGCYQPFQVVLRVVPAGGYSYLAVSTHTLPGVHSGGLNEWGLAVADSHVYSTDSGPGLPRYVLMREILERCANTPEAVKLIASLRSIGGGNLIMADADGRLAVAELGYCRKVFRFSKCFLVNTNHFVTDAMSGNFVRVEPAYRWGETAPRYQKLLYRLSSASERNLALVRELLASHEHPPLCRHSTLENPVRTISSSIYLLGSKKLLFSGDYPCSTAPYEYLLEGGR